MKTGNRERVGTDGTGSKEPRTVPYTRTPPETVPVPYPYRTPVP